MLSLHEIGEMCNFN